MSADNITKQKKAAVVYIKTDDMLYSGRNSTGLSFYIKYADGSTERNPMVTAMGVDENGYEFEQTISINKINPRNATIVEMRALEAYMGVEKQYGFSSLPLCAGNMGLYERRNFIDLFQKTIDDVTMLKQQRSIDYYKYSMRKYWNFANICRKS